jgi:Tol biopolymer transport system component
MNNKGTPETWNMETWIIQDNYIFYSIQETFNGPGQYSTKMYRMDLDGTNKILLIEDSSIQHGPRFIYDGFLYFSGYQSGVRDILYRMDPDGANIITIIKPEIRTPDRSQFCVVWGIRENWLYYKNSQINIPYELTKTTRKVRPDGTDDREVDMSIFGEDSENVDIWLRGNSVVWQKINSTGHHLFITPVTRIEDAIEIFDGEGRETPMSYYIWNGNIYIFVISWS